MNEMENTQQKINTALQAINYLTNILNVVNTEMRLIPNGNNPLHVQFHTERCLQHDSIAERLIELANDVGDLANDIDLITDEKDIEFVSNMFDFINEH